MTLQDGVHSVLATPFCPDESIDAPSIRTLLDHYVEAGVVGVLALGVLGESDKLSDAEREHVQAVVVEAAAERVQVSIGVTHSSTLVSRERACSAERAGAAAVMVSPPPGSSAGAALRDHFRRIGDGLTIPLIVQDLPEVSGVRMPIEFLLELFDDLPANSLVKLEESPSPAKMAQLREAAPTRKIFGGLGGVALLGELDAGSNGTMTGFALPRLLVEIVETHRTGDRAAARRAYEAALPLLVFEAQPVVGLGVRKEILRRLGAIAHATRRSPAPTLNALTFAMLDTLLDEVTA